MLLAIRNWLPLFCFFMTSIAERGIARHTAVTQLYLRFYLDRERARNLIAPFVGTITEWHSFGFTTGTTEVTTRFQVKNNRAQLGFCQWCFTKWTDLLLDATQ